MGPAKSRMSARLKSRTAAWWTFCGVEEDMVVESGFQRI